MTADAMASAANMVEVVTLGECMALFYPVEGESLQSAERFRKSFAGAEANVCIALARLGHSTRWISRLGDDPFGRAIRSGLEGEGVEVHAAIDRYAHTGLFFKGISVGSGREVVYYRAGSAASGLGITDIPEELLQSAAILHVTGITLALSASCAEAVDRAVRIARSRGVMVSYDPNVRLQLWASEERCRRDLTAMMSLADIVLIGDQDSAILFPDKDDAEIFMAIQSMGSETAVVKRGHRGAAAVRRGEWATVNAYPAEVVDTVGAGDGFDAGFLAGVLRSYSLTDCLALAARVGAAAVTAAGDWEGYPTFRDLGLPISSS